MAPQRLEKIESAPGIGMVSEASNPQDLVPGRAADRELAAQRNQPLIRRFAPLLPQGEKEWLTDREELQKKAPNVLKSLDAEMKSGAPEGSPQPRGRIGSDSAEWASAGQADE